MPMGNDATAAGREALLQFGDHLNAEDLIRAHAATRNPALLRVQLEAINEEETAKLREDLSVLEGKVDLLDGETILDAAVRGNAFVAVIETPHGDQRKAFGPWTDKFVEPKLSDAEAARYEQAKADGEVAAETQRVREEAAQRLREQRDQIEADTNAELTRIRQEAEKRVAEAKAEVEKGESSVSTSGSSAKKKTSSAKKSSAKKRASSKKTSASGS